jgi:hypothetical protein
MNDQEAKAYIAYTKIEDWDNMDFVISFNDALDFGYQDETLEFWIYVVKNFTEKY